MTWGVLALAGSLSGQAPPDFWPATAEADIFVGGVPVPVDWEAAARRYFTRFDPFAPDSAARTEIARNASELFGSSELPYSVPLPAALTSGHFYFATAAGVFRARPVELRGIVRFDVDRNGRLQDGPPRFYGSLVLRLSDSVAGLEGGFAFRLLAPWPDAEWEAATRSRAAFLATGLPPEPARDDAAGWFRRVTLEYELTVGAQRYLFQQLAPDHLVFEAGCVRRFRLFRLAPDRELIAELNDGCDV